MWSPVSSNAFPWIIDWGKGIFFPTGNTWKFLKSLPECHRLPYCLTSVSKMCQNSNGSGYLSFFYEPKQQSSTVTVAPCSFLEHVCVKDIKALASLFGRLSEVLGRLPSPSGYESQRFLNGFFEEGEESIAFPSVNVFSCLSAETGTEEKNSPNTRVKNTHYKLKKKKT